MREKWRELAAYEKLLVLVVYAIGFLPFLLLRELRTTVAGSAVVYLALMPVALVLLVAWYRELKLRRTLHLVGLSRAIGRGELVLHYQPQLRLHPRRVVSVEALVRWDHPRRGILPPAAFLPYITDSWLAKQLDLAVLELALGQAADWERSGRPLKVAVNFSPRSLLDSSLPHEVEEALRRHGVSPEHLEIELTEVAFNGDDDFQPALEHMKRLGAGIALDDFGIGHSSLERLVRLPVDRLKIDRGFVSDMGEDRRCASVVRATIDVAHDLEVATVAEGVEDEMTVDALTQLNCDFAQGYFFSRPLPADEIPACRERLESGGR